MTRLRSPFSNDNITFHFHCILYRIPISNTMNSMIAGKFYACKRCEFLGVYAFFQLETIEILHIHSRPV